MICILITVKFSSLPIFTEWKHLVYVVEICKPLLKVIPVKWIKPPDGCLKLNIDGCSKGLASGGGCLRNQYGDLIMAYSTFFGSCTNNMAEARAILAGTPWQIAHLIEHIHEMRQEGHIKFSHCYREANCTADLLANWSIHRKYSTFFMEANTLPMKVRAALKNDQLVNFRIRTTKKSFNA
ncbi:uncharacterized protein LOC142167013 [Nicotiana tabacum]|uniref:Uncharacterized protein LOC142167013 n=1 Tax=Nicotiana tabacum TaxID=4097 RepID=A0AC58SE81_TOBAC